MKKLIALAIVLALPSCANTIAKIQTAYTSVTDASIPGNKLLIAANTYDAVAVTGKNYIVYCSPNPAPSGCSNIAIKNQVIPALKTGKVARDEIKNFLRAHPGELGSKGLYDSVISATNIINAVTANYKG